MNSFLKKLPLPITGLMLGLFALGNLLQSYSESLRNLLGIIAFAILILVTLKIILFPKGIKEALENPVVASVFPTFSMSVMLLPTYLKPYSQSLAMVFWVIGVLLHIGLMAWFTNKFVLHNNYNIKKVFPSWFIPYVGLAVGSVSSPAVGMQALGKVIFYFALASFVVLLPIVLKRVLSVKEIPEPALACMGIIAAPASLCLAGYMNSFDVKNTGLVYILLLVSQILYWAVILYLPKILKLKFYPSYSGYTFPIVISGIAVKLTNGFLVKSGNPIGFLKSLVLIEEALAFALCLYVLFRYLKFSFEKEVPVASTNK